MSLFIAIIIILLVWFLLISPFVKLMRVSRQWQNTFKQAQQQQRYRRKTPQHDPRPKAKKKIDPTVGEYVEFTEMQVSQTTAESDGRFESAHTTESQITDVTWEDLPPRQK